MEIDQSLDLHRDHLFDRIVLYGATGLFTFTIFLTTIQVFVRLLNLPTYGFLHWTEPAARFVLIVATYLGAAVAIRNSEHIAIRFLLERLRGWNVRIGLTVQLLGKLIVIGFLLVAFRGTVLATIGNWTTSIGGIGIVTAGHLYLGIAIGMGLMALYALLDIVLVARGLVTDSTDDVEGRGIEEGTVDE